MQEQDFQRRNTFEKTLILAVGKEQFFLTGIEKHFHFIGMFLICMRSYYSL